MNTVRAVDSRVGIRNAFTRMPFRFGVVTMRAAPVATVAVTVETLDGRRAVGYAADFLAYKWFDKRPDRTPADNVADLLLALRCARDLYAAGGADTAFGLWHRLHPEIEAQCLADGFNRLGASFGSSMMERAVIDAVGRLTGRPFDAMVRDGTLGIDPAAVFPELTADAVTAALPPRPLDRVALRHTVGLVDPITAADRTEPVDDGFPETLADYLHVDGVRYLKVKVSGQHDDDIDRLIRIATLIAAQDHAIAITLDGNEQYKTLDAFVGLMEAVRAQPALAPLYDAILFVEQPLERSVAMAAPIDRAAAAAIGRPMLIDEADGWTTAFAEAIDLGYCGVSHKNCKGVFRSLLNAALAAARNRAAGETRYFLSAEDLTNLPVVPLQADLTAVATLGIGHVERNGHHYFRGLDHLPAAESGAALARHPDLYARHAGTTALAITDGMLSTGSLQVPGFGFADPPDMNAMIAEEAWRFDMLEQPEMQP